MPAMAGCQTTLYGRPRVIAGKRAPTSSNADGFETRDYIRINTGGVYVQ